MIRQTFLLPLLAAAIGGPFLLMSGSSDKTKTEDSQTEAERIKNMKVPEFVLDQKTFYKPEQNLQEVFGFHLKPKWVAAKYDNVTETKINGYKVLRASILTGHGPQDLVGAITYQFDFRDNMKSIRFNGFANDPQNLIQFGTSQFGLRPDPESPGNYASSGFSSIKAKLDVEPSKRYDGQFKLAFELTN